jgi:hypothetical protein
MDERLFHGLIGFAVLCVALSVYLIVVVQDGPKPVHELRQPLLDGKQFSAMEVICGSGAPSGRLKQAEPSVTNR